MPKFIVRPGLDILQFLKDKGYSSYRLCHEGLLSPRSVQKLRAMRDPDCGQMLSWSELAAIVNITHRPFTDFIAFQTDDGKAYVVNGGTAVLVGSEEPTKKTPPASFNVYDDDGEEVMPDFLQY